MSFTPDQRASLSAPLSRDHIKKREQAGRKLSYIEGWHAINEANRIFGFDAWDRETVEMRLVVERETKIGQAGRNGWRVGYVAKVRVRVLTGDMDADGTRLVLREGTGYGSGIDVDLGSAHESAVKEAETDAMKRALMTFGNPFGLALYDKDQSEVAEPRKEVMPNGPKQLPHHNAKPPSSEAGAARPFPAEPAEKEKAATSTDAAPTRLSTNAPARALYKRIAQEIVDAVAPEEVGRVLDIYALDIEGLPAGGQNGIRELARKRYNELRAT